MSASDFTQRLVQALGPDTVIAAEADIAPWLSDWRGLYKGNAQAVVRPRTTAEVATCLALCQEAGVPVVPRGGHTGRCGGATPAAAAGNVVLSLDRMNAVRSIDTIANTMVAEAGAILGNLRRAAQDAGRLLPLSLAAEDSSQIGGNVATNAGGVNVVRYGMARELVLGLEAVLPTGEIFHGLRTLRKDNTGYDLKQLLIGSEGTLGVALMCARWCWPPSSRRRRPCNCSRSCSNNAVRGCRRSSTSRATAWIWCWRTPRVCRNLLTSAIRPMCWWSWRTRPMRPRSMALLKT
jgi:FAD/FMN-containing dehydrogenase